MSFLELLLIAIGLSADAFAVALGKGLSMHKVKYRDALLIAAFFGFFQAFMPWIGWLVCRNFKQYITAVDHWIAFILLAFIGIKMIVDTIREKESEANEYHLDIKELLLLAVATSIDALAVGITFAFLDVRIYPSILLIGVVTFLLSLGGVVIGNRFGARFKKRAEIAGGIVIILIGVKILLEHLEIISF